MIITLHSMKGGSGVSTTAALTALAARKNIDQPVTLVDLCGDQHAIFGRPPAAGIAEWAARGLPPEDLDSTLDDAASGVHLLGRGAGPLPPRGRQAAEVVDGLLVWMATRGTVVVDAGNLHPGWDSASGPGYDLRCQLSAASDHTMVVVRRCYLAARRAPSMPHRASRMIVVDEGGDRMTPDEIGQFTGVPLAATVPVDATTARAVDSGLIAPLATDQTLRSLGGMIARLKPTRGLDAGFDCPHNCDIHPEATISDDQDCTCRPGGCVSCAGPVPVWLDTTAPPDPKRGPVFRCDNDIGGGYSCLRPIIEWVPGVDDPSISVSQSGTRQTTGSGIDAGLDPF